MEDLVNKLETTILELGTEIQVLRTQMTKVSDENDRVVRVIDTIQKLLDEKNLITQEDLEVALRIEGEDLLRSDQDEFEALLDTEQFKKYTH